MNSLKPTSNFGPSRMVLILLLLIFVALRIAYPRWATLDSNALLSWDVMGYYLYLPAYFIYGDLFSLDFVPEILSTYNPTASYYQSIPLENGNQVMKYSIGTALFYLPFFFIGHGFASILGYATDGFSAPYQMAIGFGAIFYSFLALGILRRVLLNYFSDTITAWTLVFMVLGTNYLHYVAIDGGLSHVYLFFLYSLMIHMTIKWHREGKWTQALFIGLITGWATITRPTDILIGFIPILWLSSSSNIVREKVDFLLEKKGQIILIFFSFFVVLSIQLVYWKLATGNWIYYSYGDQGFNWLTPRFDKVLFGFEKGWFIYTPMMIFAVIGLFFIQKKIPNGRWAIWTFFIINIYVICAWAIWNYASSWSCRALVQSYPVLFLSFAAFLFFIWEKKIIRSFVIAFCGLLTLLSFFQLWQYNEGILNSEANSKAYYFRVFGKTSITPYDQVFLDTEDHLEESNKTIILNSENLDFELDTTEWINHNLGYNSTSSLRCTSKNPFNDGFTFTKKELPKGTNWLKVEAQIYFRDWTSNPILVTSTTENKKTIKWIGVRTDHILTKRHVWNKVYFYYKIPSNLGDDAEIKIYPYLSHGTDSFLDNFTVHFIKSEE